VTPKPHTEVRWLCLSIAAVWLATGVAVLHPYYREVGTEYLAPLGLPASVMVATCVAEIVLGLRVALGRPARWLMVLQVLLILCFTTILACSTPGLLVNPFGMVTKNLPLLATIGTAWLVDREGWTPRARWLLRAGMALIWITEGIFPKILFQQEVELNIVADTVPLPADPHTILAFIGVCQALSGVLALLLKGRPLQVVLVGQIVALVLLPVVVGFLDWHLWVHPFMPLVKNIPILAGTVLVLLHGTAPGPILSKE
jgi:uncharacterized membrane protein YphA (DoxX/SURF4 family)